jgi:hypothetical protein
VHFAQAIPHFLILTSLLVKLMTHDSSQLRVFSFGVDDLIEVLGGVLGFAEVV